MRILHLADLHYALPQFDWVVRRAPDYDLVVLAGDCLNIASELPLHAQSVVVLRYLELLRAAVPLAVGSGNHDLTGPDAQGEQCALWLAEARAAGVPSDGDSLQLGDALVSICPWWDGPQGRRTVEAQLAADAARRPSRWLWVYHWPPLGSLTCWTGKRNYGDDRLGGYTTVGNLMGRLVGGNLWIEGLFARGMYMSLYKMHELALHGAWKTALGTAARFIFRRTVPRVKLH